MKRAVLVSPREFRLEDVPVPKIGPDEVLVKVKSCSICGSDIHAYQGKHPFISPPICLGHEFAGDIVETGRNVTGFKTGDRVIAEGSVTCGSCYQCIRGRYNICDELKVVGCQTDGAFAEFVKVAADKLHAIPEGMNYEQASLVEPMACGMRAVKIGNVQVGSSVLVFGAGVIGLSIAAISRISGAREVVVIDPLDYRLDLARTLGATLTFNPRKVNIETAVRQALGKNGLDVIFEAVGIEETIRSSVLMSKKSGTIVVVGVFGDEVKVPMGLVQDRELILRGSLMYLQDDFRDTLYLIQQGLIDAGKLITHRFSLDNIKEAFEIAVSRSQEVVKVIILPD